MNPKSPWEEERGVRFLRLYRTDLCPDWPRIVVLDLSAEQFDEFHRNPLTFAENYHLYPEQPIRWSSHVAMPPVGEGIPRAAKGSRWTVVLNHCKASVSTSSACPQSVTGCKDGTGC